MPLISFTPSIQRHVACPTCDVTGRTVRAVLENFFKDNKGARGYVLDDQGALRRHMNIFVNGEPIADRTALSDAVADRDEIFVMQALSGG